MHKYPQKKTVCAFPQMFSGASSIDVFITTLYTPEFTNMASWKIPIFNVKNMVRKRNSGKSQHGKLIFGQVSDGEKLALL